MTLRWLRRQGQERYGIAHALAGDVPLCHFAAVPAGTVTRFQGRTVKPLVEVELTAAGTPYGRVCAECLGAIRRREDVATRRLVKRACASMDRRALWVRAGEGRRAP